MAGQAPPNVNVQLQVKMGIKLRDPATGMLHSSTETEFIVDRESLSAFLQKHNFKLTVVPSGVGISVMDDDNGTRKRDGSSGHKESAGPSKKWKPNPSPSESEDEVNEDDVYSVAGSIGSERESMNDSNDELPLAGNDTDNDDLVEPEDPEPMDEEELSKSETTWRQITVGRRVFAPLDDDGYHSGLISEHFPARDAWKVDFNDETSREISTSDILPIRRLGVGMHCTYNPTGFKKVQVEILGQKVKKRSTGKKSVRYAIQVPGMSAPILCARSALGIRKKEAKKLRKKQPKEDNSRGLNFFDGLVIPSARVTRSQSRANSEVGGYTTGNGERSTRDDGSMKSKSEAKKSRKTKVVQESNPPTPQPSSSENDDDWFTGDQFFLTTTCAHANANPSETYDIVRVLSVIDNHGGTIIKQVGDEDRMTPNRNTFVISNDHSKSPKYIYGVASNFKLLSHQWIYRCHDEGRRVPYTDDDLLPAGYSVARNMVIGRPVAKPLSGLKLYLFPGIVHSYKPWKRVLISAEAVVMEHPEDRFTIIPAGTQYVVLLDKPSQGLVSEAGGRRIHVVTLEWAIQAITTGALPKPRSYPFVEGQSISYDDWVQPEDQSDE